MSFFEAKMFTVVNVSNDTDVADPVWALNYSADCVLQAAAAVSMLVLQPVVDISNMLASEL